MPEETTTRGNGDAEADQIVVRLDRLTRRLITIERRISALERWRMEATAASLEKTPDD